MARSYASGKFRRAAGEGDTVVVQGFSDLQRALGRIEGGVQPELRKRIRVIGEHVKVEARGNVPHKTGRHGAGPRIESTLKVSVTNRGASVYTTAPHGGAINVGGRVGRGQQTILKRADASHYMDKAVKSSQPFVQQETEAVMQWLLHTFEQGD